MTCRALRQRQQRFPVLFLSTGGTCWHADERRMSIAAAIQWALESNLQGLVLDSGAVQEQSQAVAMARSKGLKVHKAPIPSCIAACAAAVPMSFLMRGMVAQRYISVEVAQNVCRPQRINREGFNASDGP